MNRKGFAPIILLAIVGVAVVTGTVAGYIIFFKKSVPSNQIVVEKVEVPLAAEEESQTTSSIPAVEAPTSTVLTQKEADSIFIREYDKLYMLAGSPNVFVNKFSDPTFLAVFKNLFTSESVKFIEGGTQYFIQSFGSFALGGYKMIHESYESNKKFIPLTDSEIEHYKSLFKVTSSGVDFPPPGSIPENLPISFNEKFEVSFNPPHLTNIINNERIRWNVESYYLDLARSGLEEWKFDLITPYRDMASLDVNAKEILIKRILPALGKSE